jgi:hypothetical protein
MNAGWVTLLKTQPSDVYPITRIDEKNSVIPEVEISSQRHVTAELLEYVKANAPIGFPLTVAVMDQRNEEACRLAHELHQILRENAFDVEKTVKRVDIDPGDGDNPVRVVTQLPGKTIVLVRPRSEFQPPFTIGQQVRDTATGTLKHVTSVTGPFRKGSINLDAQRTVAYLWRIEVTWTDGHGRTHQRPFEETAVVLQRLFTPPSDP